MILRLDIGSGPNPKDGFMGVDMFMDDPLIVKAPMWSLPYDDNTVEEIYSSHALEHVGRQQIKPTLEEWHRVLKPGGRLTLEVPDLRWGCRNFLNNQEDLWAFEVLFGNQDVEDGQFHKWGFTPGSLCNYLRQAGFGQRASVGIITSHNQDTIRCVVFK
jgi:predicted SAM-dependent methyltransferase